MAGRRKRGLTPLAAGIVALVVILVGSYLGFTKHIPFTHGFRVKAVFTSAVSIRKGSPVRIAGVNVGKVKSVARYKKSDDSVVTMEIDKAGLPIHSDSTLQIRPRIFLEGNFFVDLKPGTPGARTVHDDDTLPVTQTSVAVQLDQVLTALQGDTRSDLQSLLSEYGAALNEKPAAGEDKTQDPEVRGLTGAQGLRKTLKYSPEALRASSVVNHAFLGTRIHDLSGVVANLATVTKSLNTREAALKDLITNFNTTVTATAAEASNLREGIHRLGPTLTTGYNALGDLNAALPSTRAFARDILPGTRESAATTDASFPFIRQTKALVGPSELQGVARQLRRSSPSLGALIDGTTRLLPQIDLIDRCFYSTILPTGDVKITADGFNSGSENYKEFWYSMVGLAGEGQNFDGNGIWVRTHTGGGLDTIRTGKGKITGEALVANTPNGETATAPAYPGKLPAYKPFKACYKNGALTSQVLNDSPAAKGPAVSTIVHRTPQSTVKGLPALAPVTSGATP